MTTTIEHLPSTKTTAEIAEAMLKEDTGRGITDSGGFYGRNWERNQGVDFAKTPQTWARFGVIETAEGEPGRLEIRATLSLYHWMVATLEYDAEMQERLLQFAGYHPDIGWADIIERFTYDLDSDGGTEKDSVCWYTYNESDACDLSQDVIITEIYDEDGYVSHVILRVHGGCDQRSGFTSPKCFKVKNGEQFRDSLKLAGFGAGDQSWLLDGRGQDEPSDTNDCKLRLKELPAYEWEGLPETLVDTVDDALDNVRALEGAEEVKRRLELTTLKSEQVEAARQTVDAMVKKITQDLKDSCVVVLAKRHEWFVICDNGKAWLFSDDATEFSDGDAFCAFSDFV